MPPLTEEDPMRKYLFIAAFLLFTGVPALFAQSFTAGIGADFFKYERTYLDLRAAYIQPINPDVELTLGGSFAIVTKNEGGTTEADFLIPLDGGVNFLFPVNETFAYQFGLGLTAQFVLETDSRFYMGPFISFGVRFGVHPFMEWYIEGRQDLLFGKPEWISTSTRLSTGVIFAL